MSDTKPPFVKEYALVGELVLTVSGLDFQLTNVLIALLHLAPSPLLFPVISALDTRRKIEMLKARAAHMPGGNKWKENALKYVDLVERADKGRNTACHLKPRIDGETLSFVPIDAARVLKKLDVDAKSVKEVKIERLQADLLLAQKALWRGEDLLLNLKQANEELDRRRSKKQLNEPAYIGRFRQRPGRLAHPDALRI